MLQKVKEGKITIEKVVEKMAHNPAILFQIEDRGYVKEGFFADLVIVDPKQTVTVSKDNVLYQCGWSPFEGVQFDHAIDKTFVNGNLVYSDGKVIEGTVGDRLLFNR
jgi:dihydroorotase